MKKLLMLLLCLLLTGCAQSYDGPTVEARVLLQQEFFDVDGEERTCTFLVVNSYDVYGNLARTSTQRKDYLEVVTNYRYDDQGRERSATTWETRWGIPIFRKQVNTTYDDQNRMVRQTVQPLAFWEGYHNDYTYADGVTTMTRTDRDGNQTLCWEEHTDDQGRISKNVYEDYTYHYHYDDAGNRIREERMDDARVTYWTDRTYDDQGRMLSQSYPSTDGTLRTHRWVYDDEVHTVTLYRWDGYVTVEHYNEYGENYYTAKYNDRGVLTGEDWNTYGVIQVPTKEDAS